MKGLRAYCFLHADRAAQGENVVNDLTKSGLADSTYHDWSCVKISETLQAEEKAESERIAAFSERCEYGNLTPSQYWQCDHAGYSPSGALCLFEEDREEAQERISEGGKAPSSN